MGYPTPLTAGPRLLDGSDLNIVLAANASSYTDGIVAFAGGGQTNAVPLISVLNNVVTVASASDSVSLPKSYSGFQVFIQNSGANSVRIFANPSSSLPSGVQDTINGTAGATGILIAAGKTAILSCFTTGAWIGPVALA